VSGPALEFSPSRPRPWSGRYARVPGETTAIHVRRLEGEWWPVVDWAVEDEIGHCRMVDEGDVAALAEAVCTGKRSLSGRAGGSFLVNEFGQVLVPASDWETSEVVLVGECTGAFAFHNPFRPGEVIDLADGRALSPGEAWARPYVGIPHNLSAGSEIYFKQVDEFGLDYAKPEQQDARLIAALRKLRPYGPVRFLVGVGGIVITKVPIGQAWEPRYVGKIDPARWFSKEG
jgi:hypothetical protein